MPTETNRERPANPHGPEMACVANRKSVVVPSACVLHALSPYGAAVTAPPAAAEVGPDTPIP